MITTLYEQYIWLIGQLKDLHKVHVEADHQDIHTFYDGRFPLFKLLYGRFTNKKDDHIVVSFHINVSPTAAIEWWTNIRNQYPLLKVAETYIEDDRGETYLGDDATKIYTAKMEQQILKVWLETSKSSKEDVKKFVESKIVGRNRDYKKSYKESEMDKALIEFDLMKKPVHDDEVN